MNILDLLNRRRLQSLDADGNILSLSPTLWWDDDDIPGTTNGDAVSSWTDRILEKTVVAHTTNPTLEIAGGIRSVKFSGTNALTSSEFTEIDFNYNDPFTVVIQMGNSIVNTGTLVGKQESGLQPVHFQVQRNTTFSNAVGVNVNALGNAEENYFNQSFGTAWTSGSVLTTVFDGTAKGVVSYQNNTSGSMDTLADIGRQSGSQNQDLYFGARGNGGGTLGYAYAGSISNILFFNRALTETEISTLVSNL